VWEPEAASPLWTGFSLAPWICSPFFLVEATFGVPL
jgi:hypothetical protein